MTAETKSSVYISYIDKASEICLIAWMIVYPFSSGISITLLVINTCLLIYNIYNKKLKLFQNLIKFPAIILFLLLLLSIIQSYNHWMAIKEMKHNIPLILSTFVIYHQYHLYPKNTEKGLKYLFFSSLATFIITAIFNLLPFESATAIHQKLGNLLQPFEKSDSGLFGWYVPTMVRIFFGNLLSYLSIFLLVYGIEKKNKKWIVASILNIILVSILGVRGSMLALSAAMILPILYIIRQKIKLQTSKKWVFIFITILIPTLFFTKNKVLQRWNQTKFEIEVINNNTFEKYEYQHFTTLTRFISWQNGYELWQKNKIYGTGIGDYKAEFAEEYKNDQIHVPLYYHSQWLYFLDVFGIAGLLIFLLFYIQWLIQNSRYKASKLYGISLTVYIFIIWIFDAGMLSQIDMMSFGIFTTLIVCFKEK